LGEVRTLAQQSVLVKEVLAFPLGELAVQFAIREGAFRLAAHRLALPLQLAQHILDAC
jgi:hypothetical protein